MTTRAQQSLLAGRSAIDLNERQIRSVGSTFRGLDDDVPFQYDPVGHTRFVVDAEEDEDIGLVYFGRDIYPGPSVLDPNSALSMQAAVAHEISHFHRWQDRTELPLNIYRHLDEALTSLDAALRFVTTLSEFEMQQLIRDAIQRLQLHYAELSINNAEDPASASTA
jgi:hypothetical protein